jgi:hypothetical protein
MYRKFLRGVQVFGAIGWVAVVVAAIFSIIQAVITGDYSPMLGVIVLVLVAINFNLSMLVGYKRREFENIDSILQKAESMAGPVGRANPYLN